MSINLHLPGKPEALRPSITVIGVGGAGGNAVNNMISSNLEGVSFVVANTDAQALENSLTERRIQLGADLTRGLGAGASPEVGRAAAEEAMEEVAGHISGSNMVFITAGMGGGTGTGAAPVIARLAKERGILTVGVVTKPFQFEGSHRMRLAEQGLRDLQQYVDTLIVIPNQNLFRIANEKTTFADAFRMADEVLHSGVRGVTDLMIMPGLINLDFADIRTVMSEMGKAMMGTGEAEGAKRAVEAAEAAISNPLLDDVSMKGAKGVLINITGGYDMTLYEADEAATRIREEVDPDANIIFGATFNASLEGKIRVSVVATGIDAISNSENKPNNSDTTRAFAGKSGFTGARATDTPKPYLPSLRPATDFSKESVRRESASNTEAATTTAVKEKQDVRPAAPVAAAKPVVAVTPVAPIAAKPAPQQAPRAASEEGTVMFARCTSTFVGATSQLPDAAPQQKAAPQASTTHQHEPSFMAPHASQPTQRSFFSQQDEAPMSKTEASKGQQQAPRAAAKADSNNSSMSFFQRMANVSRALTKPEQAERTLQVVKKSDVKVSEQPAKAAEEDYLEIPAFLRRQAN